MDFEFLILYQAKCGYKAGLRPKKRLKYEPKGVDFDRILDLAL